MRMPQDKEKKKNQLQDKEKKKNQLNIFFNKFSAVVTWTAGRPVTFIIAFLVILIWALTGPIFDFSDTWQLIINTSTTIVTFLMVFVIQHSQNRDSVALQVKLDELIAASGSSNEIIDIEELDEEEIEALKAFYKNLRSRGNKKMKNSPTDEKVEVGKKQMTAKGEKPG